ncbi:variant PEP-CTERM exosortase signal [Thiorhodococcus drewsii AZ1]|uniref:Variant PEP-CTERM exosortase signal n=1 Tax=Thiorhodococcus drewsii AZ1 TaxID=765913 RepID=G2E051_9GAMM|nr:VPLPA-CTERM sorting domain-containing protein [Thiorhodococcus drewsii]EGV31779.1 variant PEP-CTERM exosortase signal [Thiorhodococcus drewsii AZ1]
MQFLIHIYDEALNMRLFQSAIALLLLSLATVANAATINGSIDFTGEIILNASIPDAVSVSFGAVEANYGNDDLKVMNGAKTGSSLTFQGFKFDPDEVSGKTIWSFNSGQFSFNADEVESVTQNKDPNYLVVVLSGTLSSTDTLYETTPAYFTITTQGTRTTASFSAGATSVPLPAAGWLFGSAMLGLAGIAKRRKTARA